METSGVPDPAIIPVKGKTLDKVNKESKYIVKISAQTDLSYDLFDYSECFFEAGYKISEYIL